MNNLFTTQVFVLRFDLRSDRVIRMRSMKLQKCDFVTTFHCSKAYLFWLLSSENKSQNVQYGLLSVPPYFSSPVITCSAWHPWQRPFCHCHLYIDSLLPAKVHLARLAHMILWLGFYGSFFESLVDKYIN